MIAVLPLNPKLTREFKRFKQQIFDLGRPISDPVKDWLWKHKRAREFERAKGEAELTKKIAVFLIYQPGEIPKSLILTLEHLLKNGYSTLVVSNAVLTDASIKTLRTYCYRVLVRPNLGHDFGGYRDAIWYIEENSLSVEILLVLNDSIWFPLEENCTAIRGLEKSNADFGGLADGHYLTGFSKDKIAAFTKDKTLPESQYYIGSYFLLFSGPTYGSEEFKRYWQNYRISSTKKTSNRQG